MARKMLYSVNYGEARGEYPLIYQCSRLHVSTSVYQLSILESQDNDCDVPQGVVMALVGAEPTDLNADKDKDQFRSVRMYNLSSLASLASWAASQEVSTTMFNSSLSAIFK
jgi:hypothetical protein